MRGDVCADHGALRGVTEAGKRAGKSHFSRRNMPPRVGAVVVSVAEDGERGGGGDGVRGIGAWCVDFGEDGLHGLGIWRRWICGLEVWARAIAQ